MIHDFWQSSEAVGHGLSQVSKMLSQLTRQISAHYPSSKIRNTHLRLFRPDQGPQTVVPVRCLPKPSRSMHFGDEKRIGCAR